MIETEMPCPECGCPLSLDVVFTNDHPIAAHTLNSHGLKLDALIHPRLACWSCTYTLRGRWSADGRSTFTVPVKREAPAAG